MKNKFRFAIRMFADRQSRKWAFCFLGLGLILFTSMAYVLYLIMDREAIHSACREGDADRVEQILGEYPERLEQRSRLKLTPLHEAVWYGRRVVLELLISRGADVNSKWDLAGSGNSSWNPLHMAANRGHFEVAEVLIRAGTDVNWKTEKGETPLDIAVRNRKENLAQLLRDHGGLSGTP